MLYFSSGETQGGKSPPLLPGSVVLSECDAWKFTSQLTTL